MEPFGDRIPSAPTRIQRDERAVRRRAAVEHQPSLAVPVVRYCQARSRRGCSNSSYPIHRELQDALVLALRPAIEVHDVLADGSDTVTLPGSDSTLLLELYPVHERAALRIPGQALDTGRYCLPHRDSAVALRPGLRPDTPEEPSSCQSQGRAGASEYADALHPSDATALGLPLAASPTDVAPPGAAWICRVAALAPR